ncbi:hypothetical protein KIPB_004539 [Kipferlia bialata]|uniref:UEV domain-containing protein n=1 Tax=Kipferlia bialata TaxID=797122 RepID=A0A9K3GHI8_9EUKA|nr:hypothetical protein KIPB_004539 [Kipferlia bialata]|eukprot:g4539.t1
MQQKGYQVNLLIDQLHYQNKHQVKNDVSQVLNAYPRLQPSQGVMPRRDGSKVKVLYLGGCVPFVYQYKTYQCPIGIFLDPCYPRIPPTIVVTPTAGTYIRDKHPNVARDTGYVTLPYIKGWTPNMSQTLHRRLHRVSITLTILAVLVLVVGPLAIVTLVTGMYSLSGHISTDGASIDSLISSHAEMCSAHSSLCEAQATLSSTVADLKASSNSGTGACQCVPEEVLPYTLNDDRVLAKGRAVLNSLIDSGKARVCVLGDSTEVDGVVYGSTSSGSFGALTHYAMIKHDPLFIPISSSEYPVSLAYGGDTSVYTSLGSLPFDSWQATKGTQPVIQTTLSTPSVTSFETPSVTCFETVTMYINERTADAAAVFRATVTDCTSGVVLYQGVIDSYTAPDVYKGVDVSVISRVAKLTVPLSAPSVCATLTLDEFDTLPRTTGGTARGDGTVAFYGFALGNGVAFHSLAVSSTTLLEDSAANVYRGVSTSERLGVARSLDCNVYIIGWCTNDSKAGVSTKQGFRHQYITLLSSIESGLPDGESLVVMATDPRGKEGSAYVNNPEYNAVVRELATSSGHILLDVEALSDVSDASFYRDSVHPSQTGRVVIAEALNSLLGL